MRLLPTNFGTKGYLFGTGQYLLLFRASWGRVYRMNLAAKISLHIMNCSFTMELDISRSIKAS